MTIDDLEGCIVIEVTGEAKAALDRIHARGAKFAEAWDEAFDWWLVCGGTAASWFAIGQEMRCEWTNSVLDVWGVRL